MRSAIVIGAVLSGLAVASPLAKRQEIDIDAVEAAGQVQQAAAPLNPLASHGSYDADAATDAAAHDPVTTSSQKVKRGSNDCKPEPAGSGPGTSPDTDVDFLNNPVYNQTAAAATTPDGYALVAGPVNAGASSPSYITYQTLTSYNTVACQQFCDQADSCYAFNIYIERDPTITPADACPNPSSTVNYKCTLFGAQLTSSALTNAGGWRDQFHVVIAGSNIYNKLAPPATQPGYTGPVEFGGAINCPDNSYIGSKYFPGPYNPSQCLNACTATTQYNQRHANNGTYNTCSFVNTYVLSKNGAPQGTYCGLYTKTWGKSYATNYGQYRGNDYYSVSQSYGWSLSSN